MRYNTVFILLHWLLAVASIVLLGLGWYLQAMPMAADIHVELTALHVSLGLAAAILLALALLIRLLFGAPPLPAAFGFWSRLLGGFTHLGLYLSLIVLLGSGYLHEVFSGAPVLFFETPLPAWGETNPELAQNLKQTHQIAAYALAGFIGFHLLLVAANSARDRSFALRMVPGGRRESMPLAEEHRPRAQKVVQKLASRLRLVGWLQFWLQFMLAVVSGALLQFATSGRIFSTLTLGFGDAMHWGAAALALLFVTCGLAFGAARTGRRLALSPESYLEAGAPNFLRVTANLALSFAGFILAFVGVALSIVLFIGKTVSQPPGIAITDPSKIIRALDVFVLLLNFLLLLGHSVGLGAALWLGFETRRARSIGAELRSTPPTAQPMVLAPVAAPAPEEPTNT